MLKKVKKETLHIHTTVQDKVKAQCARSREEQLTSGVKFRECVFEDKTHYNRRSAKQELRRMIAE